MWNWKQHLRLFQRIKGKFAQGFIVTHCLIVYSVSFEQSKKIVQEANLEHEEEMKKTYHSTPYHNQDYDFEDNAVGTGLNERESMLPNSEMQSPIQLNFQQSNDDFLGQLLGSQEEIKDHAEPEQVKRGHTFGDKQVDNELSLENQMFSPEVKEESKGKLESPDSTKKSKGSDHFNSLKEQGAPTSPEHQVENSELQQKQMQKHHLKERPSEDSPPASAKKSENKYLFDVDDILNDQPQEEQPQSKGEPTRLATFNLKGQELSDNQQDLNNQGKLI